MSIKILSVIIFSIILINSTVFSQTMYGADQARTFSVDAVGISANPQMVWTQGDLVSHESEDASNMVIAGDSVYFIRRYRLYCLNMADGAKAFEVAQCHGTPTIRNDTLWAHRNSLNTISAFNRHTGAEIWSKPCSYVPTSKYHASLYRPSIVLMGDTLYANASSYSGSPEGPLYAIRISTKEEIWRYSPASEFSVCSPTIGGGRIYLPRFAEGTDANWFWRTGTSCVMAFNRHTGDTLWTYNTAAQRPIKSTMVYHDEKLYYADAHPNGGSCLLHCLNAETGRELWKIPLSQKEIFYHLLLYKTKAGTPGDGKYVIILSGKGNLVTAVLADAPLKLWEKSADASNCAVEVLHKIVTKDEGILYCAVASSNACAGGLFVAMDANTGDRLWSWQFPGHKSESWPYLVAAPAIKDGKIAVPTWQNMYLLQGESSEISFTASSIKKQARIITWPNPFSGRIRISLIGQVANKNYQLNIFDSQGNLVRTLSSNGNLLSGNNGITWDGLDNSGFRVNAGIYIYRLMVNQNQIITGKPIFVLR
ncbi:MAG: PQQ-binding-like beta-propeller repeat protein [bacterium]